MSRTARQVNVQKSLTRAAALARRHDFAAARQVLDEVLERFPANRKARQLAREIDMREARLQRPRLTPEVTRAAFGLLEKGLVSEALAEADLLTRAFPDEPVLHNFRATCLYNSGRPDEAQKAWERAIALKPDYAEPHLNLAVAHWQRDRIGKSLFHVEAALRIRPAYAAAQAHKAVLLTLLNRPQEALRHHHRALELAPDNGDFHNDIGTTWRFIGARDKAREAFRRAVELQPANAMFHSNLAELHAFRPDDPYLAQLERLSANPELPPYARARLLYAQARAAEALGQADRLFALLHQAGQAQKQAAPYDPAETEKDFARIRALFRDGPLPAVQVPDNAPRPLFVIGMPRSGTTLVEQILSRHPLLVSGGEMPHTDRILGPLLDGDTPPDAAALSRARALWMEEARLFDPRPEANRPVILDKMPMNFRWLGILAAMFPEARFVNLKRDPMAVAWSNYRLLFSGGGVRFAYDFDDIAHYMRQYLDMMAFWRPLFGARILDLDYEALTEDPEPHIRRLVAFADLPWDDACLDENAGSQVVRTASVDQVRKGIYKGSSQAWRAHEERLAPLKEALLAAGVPLNTD